MNENPTKNDSNNKKQTSKITVDSFIDELVEFEEIVTSKGNDFLLAQQVSLNLEIYHQLNYNISMETPNYGPNLLKTFTREFT